MYAKRPELPYRHKFNPIHWAISYPLFAIAIAMGLGLIATVSWIFARDFVPPGNFVVVEVYPINLSMSQNGVTVEYNRITYQPGYRKRLSQWVENQSEPLLMIDGWVINDSPQQKPLVAFLQGQDGYAGVTFYGGPDGETRWPARVAGAYDCPAIDYKVARTSQGGKRRMGIVLKTDGGPAEWIRKSIEEGVLPAHEIGDFAFADCSADTAEQFAQTTRLKFDAVDLLPAQEHDYYPFGAPTGGRTSVNDRPYWNIWLVRQD